MALNFYSFGYKEPLDFSNWTKTFLEGTYEVGFSADTHPELSFYDVATGIMNAGIKAIQNDDVFGYYSEVYDKLDMLIAKLYKESSYKSYEAMLEDIHKTLVSKNIDYGNSFGNVINKIGLPGAVIRVMDKQNRLKTLQGENGEVMDESTFDTKMDLVGYLVLTLEHYRDKSLDGGDFNDN